MLAWFFQQESNKILRTWPLCSAVLNIIMRENMVVAPQEPVVVRGPRRRRDQRCRGPHLLPPARRPSDGGPAVVVCGVPLASGLGERVRVDFVDVAPREVSEVRHDPVQELLDALLHHGAPHVAQKFADGWILREVLQEEGGYVGRRVGWAQGLLQVSPRHEEAADADGDPELEGDVDAAAGREGRHDIVHLGHETRRVEDWESVADYDTEADGNSMAIFLSTGIVGCNFNL